MKNNIFFKAIYFFSISMVLSLTAFAQSNLSEISMLGPGYKVLSQEKFNRYSLGTEVGHLFPLLKCIENYDGGGMDHLLNTMYSDPALLERLFETLGGEFFVGSMTGEAGFENFEQKGGFYFGASGACRLSPKITGKAHFGTYKTEITAEFPIVIFDQTTFEPVSAKGELSTTMRTNTFQITGNYFPFKGLVQPFAGAGVIYTSTKSSTTRAQLGTMAFDLSENLSNNSFGLAFHAGVEVAVHPNIVLQLNGQVFSQSSIEDERIAWNKALTGGVGFRF